MYFQIQVLEDINYIILKIIITKKIKWRGVKMYFVLLQRFKSTLSAHLKIFLSTFLPPLTAITT